MYNKIGRKIMGIVKVLTVLGIIVSIIFGILIPFIFGGDFIFIILGLCIAGIGSLISYVNGLALYAFGELVDNVNDIHSKVCGSSNSSGDLDLIRKSSKKIIS